MHMFFHQSCFVFILHIFFIFFHVYTFTKFTLKTKGRKQFSKSLWITFENIILHQLFKSHHRDDGKEESEFDAIFYQLEAANDPDD